MTTYLSDGSTIDDWKIGTPAEIAYVEPLPDPAEVLAERVALAIADLKDTLNALPAPQVHVAAPELGAIVQAVTSLNGPASAEDIAEAIARTLRIPEPESNQPLVDAILKAFEKMDHRMKGMVPAFGASGPSNISSDANRLLGHVTVDNELTFAGTVSTEASNANYGTKLAYGTTGGALGQLIYVGSAAQGTAGSASHPQILRLYYHATLVGLLMEKQVLAGAWDSRTSLAWATPWDATLVSV